MHSNVHASTSGRGEWDPLVGVYLREGAGHRLLSADEEVELSTQWLDAVEARQALAKQEPSAEAQDRLEAVAQRGSVARRKLIAGNLRLVVHMATRYQGYGVPLSDLIQEGNIGLMHAVDKFDPTKGYKFSTYATWWIRHAIGRAIAMQGRTVRLPVHMADKARQIKSVSAKMAQVEGEKPSPSEIGEAVGLSEQRVRTIMYHARPTLSLDKTVSEDDQRELLELLPDEHTENPEGRAMLLGLRDNLETALGSLTAREAMVLNLRYGLRDGREHTLEEVGDKYGLTRERIRQIERDALRKLRHPSRSRNLRSYLD